MAQVDIPKPVALLFALFGMERTGRWREPWFQAIRVWSEVGDVCESDSFGETVVYSIICPHTVLEVQDKTEQSFSYLCLLRVLYGID